MAEKITLVMSRSNFVRYNRDYMDLEEIVASDGKITLTDIAQNFVYLTDSDIVNWNEIKHTIDKDCIDPCGIFVDCEVAFDWNKYKIKWEE